MPPSAVFATLIADPRSAPSERCPYRACSRKASAEFESQRWLNEGVAADLIFNRPRSTPSRAAFREALAGEPVDVIVQPAAASRKAPLVADMDFDPDRPGMRRRARGLCRRGRAASLRSPSARCGRDRIRAGAARAGRAPRRSPRERHCRRAQRSHHAEPRRARSCPDDACERRLCGHRLRRLSPVHWRDPGAAWRRRGPRQYARRLRTASSPAR